MIAIPVIVNVVVPTFVNVTVLAALVTPTGTEPKFKLVGESFAVVPIPLSDTCCGLPEALSVTLSTALRVPLAVGLKLTLIVQLALAASELPQVCVWEKSVALVPVIAIPVIVSEVVPTFVSVTVFGPLVTPMATVPKLKLVGESFAVVPIPLSGTCCGLPEALSVTLRAALRVPLAVGLKVTLIVQLAAAASELPQV